MAAALFNPHRRKEQRGPGGRPHNYHSSNHSGGQDRCDEKDRGFGSLEGARLLFALDFVGQFREVLSQPFRLRFTTPTGAAGEFARTASAYGASLAAAIDRAIDRA
jgi:hypothetical protein